MTTQFADGAALSPIELIVLQGTSLCNLNCTYCDLPASNRRTNVRMGMDTIDRLFSELFSGDRLASEVHIVWHSGEPLTLPPSYYDEAIERILKLRNQAPECTANLKFGLQTNGVLIDEEWCRFFARHKDHLSVGVSCDGQAEMHDAFRITWAGHSSHSHATRGMDLLQQHGIKYKIIAVVTSRAIEKPDDFYRFFFERRSYLSGFHFNILAQARGKTATLSYSHNDRQKYYDFYRRLLQLNHASIEDGDEFSILNFSQCLARIAAVDAQGSRSFLEETAAPLKALNVDSRGNLITFYAGIGMETLPDLYEDGKGLSMGNIMDTTLEEMIASDKLRRMREDFASSARACKASCEYFSLCSGGFEITQKQTLGTFEGCETDECAIHVKALVDALLDDISERLDGTSPVHVQEPVHV